MCRFLVYKGVEPIQISHLVTRPRHSIINQAFESKLRLPSSRPMNADGFGIGWYDPVQTTPQGPSPLRAVANPAPQSLLSDGLNSSESGSTEVHSSFKSEEEREQEVLKQRELEQELENERPCVFKSISPAWSNANLTRLAEKIRTPLLFAHVRASTMAGAPSEDNCHPWIFDRLMWMHNGEITGFRQIKRALQQSLSEELFLYPSGYTDSEWAFMLFLSKLKDPHARKFTHIELKDAMMETISTFNTLIKEAGVVSVLLDDEERTDPAWTGPSLLNFVVSDGDSVVATRYITSRTSEASSLFFSSGTSFEEYQEGGLYRMTKADKRESIIMIASEPLTFERNEWMEVKTNTMLVITPKMNLLQIPIIDEYWVAPQDPASYNRSTDFAISMGFGHGFASAKASAEIAA